MTVFQTRDVTAIDETFPTEVMQLIFTFAISRISTDAFQHVQKRSNGLLPGEPYPDETRQAILNTSKRWRVTLNATPKAWSTIVPIPSYRHARRYFERCLYNSASEFLEVYFPPGVHLVRGWFDTQLLISFLRPHASRFSCFYAHFNAFQEEILLLQSLFPQKNTKHPHLRELGLSSDDRKMVMTATQVNFPSLTHLALSDDLIEVFRRLDIDSLRNLTSLRLSFAWKNTDLEDLRLLGCCSRLESLEIEVQTLVDFSQIQIKFASLKCLRMTVPDAQVASMLFSSLKMAQLTHLLVSFTSKFERYTSLSEILGTSLDHITHLSIHNTSLHNFDLTFLPNLTALRLFQCRLGPSSLSRTIDFKPNLIRKIRLHACQIFVEDLVELIVLRQCLALVTRVTITEQQAIEVPGKEVWDMMCSVKIEFV
ncbi:hypothetical protein M422DRAFT_46000 [Sphaerobolus stellatus SS14]|uniref:F-box domain-containing protein n=1 Tax=Sphaerobolus stellatus (strain SS14) TaxID=990650 RepID=A0A0C9VUZ7_SPHS4|nr:hypothetical protein M422DRAFT_46000 [Sphaerobolus stellatus SS14]